MSRRSPLALSFALVAASALVLSACGEQTPGGVQPGAASQQQGGQQGQQAAGAKAETAEDADNPIVVKIGEEEFRTNMAIYRKYDESKSGPLNLQAPIKSAEELDGGKKQEFHSGTIYWSPDTGAQIVRGQILKTYLDNGGARGKLGWPIGDETTEGGAVYSDFQNGRITLENMAIQVIENAG